MTSRCCPLKTCGRVRFLSGGQEMQLCPAVGESELVKDAECCLFCSKLMMDGCDLLHCSSKPHCPLQTEAWVE